MVRFLLRLDEDLHAKLKALAESDNRSLHNLIITLLRRAVA